MAMNVDVTIVGFKDALLKINQLQKKMPGANRRDAWNITQIYAKHLKRVASSQSFTGKLAKSIKPSKLQVDKYGVQIPLYGIFQDSMKPHWVKVPGKPILEAWSKQKLGFIPRSMRVKPSHWIDRGARFAFSETNAYLKTNSRSVKEFKKRGGI